jgi:hypothetical protein
MTLATAFDELVPVVCVVAFTEAGWDAPHYRLGQQFPSETDQLDRPDEGGMEKRVSPWPFLRLHRQLGKSPLNGPDEVFGTHRHSCRGAHSRASSTLPYTGD